MTQDLSIIKKKFNELTVNKYIPRPDTKKYKSWNTGLWVECECSCGEIVEVPLYGVKNGFIKSCGHLKTQQALATLNENRDSTHNAIYLTHEGKTMNISEWSQETGIPRSTITYRMNKEMPIEKVLERKDSHDIQ